MLLEDCVVMESVGSGLFLQGTGTSKIVEGHSSATELPLTVPLRRPYVIVPHSQPQCQPQQQLCYYASRRCTVYTHWMSIPSWNC